MHEERKPTQKWTLVKKLEYKLFDRVTSTLCERRDMEETNRESIGHECPKRDLTIVFAVILAPLVFFSCAFLWNSLVHDLRPTLIWAGTVIVVLNAIALCALCRRVRSETARALWALIILLFPIIGMFAFLVGTAPAEVEQGGAQP